MSSTSETTGFFTSNGALKTDSANTSSAASSAADASNNSSLVDEAAAITDEAVYTGTSKLNAGGTGYDSGVAELVGKAVTAALQKLGAKDDSAGTSDASVPAFSGGTYQNEILYGKKGGDTPPPAPSDSDAEPAEPPSDPVSGPSQPGRGRGRGGGNGHGRGVGHRSFDTEA